MIDDPVALSAVVRLWLRAFAGPPWSARIEDADRHRGSVIAQLSTAGATVVSTHTAPGDLVGVAWGWPGSASPDDALHRAVRAAVAPDLVPRLWGADTWVLVEVMVDPDHQARGIGGRLITELIGDSDAWLLTHPAGDAAGWYQRHGWTVVGDIDHRGLPLLIMARGPSLGTPAG